MKDDFICCIIATRKAFHEPGVIMNYLIKINERDREFTPSDKKIADFIRENPEELININSANLAKLTGTSQSAVIRFVQKIGYKGYLDLKLDIAKSIEDDYELKKGQVIVEGDSISDIMAKSKNNVLTAVEKTYALLDEEKIREVANLIDKAKEVYLAGIGSSGLICEDFLYKLQRAGKKASYERDAHTNIALISNISKDDILICISYSGNTAEIDIAASFAKEVGARVISITKSAKSPLANLSDELLLIPEIEKEMRFGAISSRFSSQIVTDILFYAFIVKNMDQVSKKMKMSKNLTSKLKIKSHEGGKIEHN